MPYYLAARFVNRTKTISPYASIRAIIYLEQRNKLITCRFPYDGYWYIVVIGNTPPGAVHQKLVSHMNRGKRLRIAPASLAAISSRVAGYEYSCEQ